ncbi:MAG: 4Fe-4S dicluster domain-containing protein [Planctomycetia bacterium]|nr:4Fe-4S dicluster domain-containing protein [Planctomycetia bacterium]
MIYSTSDSVVLNSQTDNITKRQQSQRKVQINGENCKACGLCIAHCPKKVLIRGEHINSMGYEATIIASPEDCTGCGLCFYSCPEPDAINVIS